MTKRQVNSNIFELKGDLLVNRPAANAVPSGTFFVTTDTNACYQSDGVSRWIERPSVRASIIFEDCPVSPGSKALLEDVECRKLDVDSAGLTVRGKNASQQDVSVETLGKGIVIKSPNGHRWRLLISNSGSITGVDLDA